MQNMLKQSHPMPVTGIVLKNIKTNLSEAEIKVPRDRESSFNPMIVSKRKSMVDGVENIMILLYAKGMCNDNIKEQKREIPLNQYHLTNNRQTHRRYYSITEQTLRGSFHDCMHEWYGF